MDLVFLEFVNRFLEDSAALLVIFEHVETGAGGRQKNYISRRRMAPAELNGFAKVLHFGRFRGSCESFSYFPGGLAQKQNVLHFPLDQGPQKDEVAGLVAPAQDDVDVSRERLPGLDRRIDACGLGII